MKNDAFFMIAVAFKMFRVPMILLMTFLIWTDLVAEYQERSTYGPSQGMMAE